MPLELAITPIATADWRTLKLLIGRVFESLSDEGLVALCDVGTTQADGFADCSEQFIARGGEAAGLHGFAFFTGQDSRRAKESALLPIAFWGAPEGSAEDMMRVGNLLVTSLRAAGLTVEWNESPDTRPIWKISSKDLEAAAELHRAKQAAGRAANRDREMKEAVEAAAELFAKKNYAAYVKKLRRFENILPPVHQKKLSFALKQTEK